MNTRWTWSEPTPRGERPAAAALSRRPCGGYMLARQLPDGDSWAMPGDKCAADSFARYMDVLCELADGVKEVSG